MDWLTQLLDPLLNGHLAADFATEVRRPEFWVALTKIIWINVLLSGDNALVIALACRGLDPRQRFWGMVLGAGVAVFLRIIFTGIVATLMSLPYLKLVGGLALIVIAAKLLVPENDDEEVQSASNLWAAVQIVAVADIIMSLDNVIAVAAAADGSVLLLILGLVISIPMIVAGAALIMALLDRRRRDLDRSGGSTAAASAVGRSDRAQHRCGLDDVRGRQGDKVRRTPGRVYLCAAVRCHCPGLGGAVAAPALASPRTARSDVGEFRRRDLIDRRG